MNTMRKDVDTDQIVRRYSRGEAPTNIAQTMGLHYDTVKRRLVDAGLFTSTRVPQEKIDRARELLEDRSGYAQAAATVGVSPHTLRRRLPGYGLTIAETTERQTMGRQFARMEKKR